MKKIVLFIMAVMAFAGMSIAQDVWSCGYYNDGDRQQAAVYKNNTKMYNTSFSGNYHGDCTDVDVYNGDVYWVKNCYDGDDFNYADVMKNNTTYLDSPQFEGRHIYDLYRSPSSGYLFAVGCKTVNGVKTAVRWRNNEPDPLGQMGDGVYESVAYGVATIVNDGYVYSVGYQYTSSGSCYGTLWKGNSVYHTYPENSKIYDMVYFNGFFYVVGTWSNMLCVWKTSATDSSNSVMFYTLASSEGYGSERTKIYIDKAGDIYVTGQQGSPDKIWKNGTEIYSTPGYFNSVIANTNGVYYVGGSSGTGKVWKDGSVLYSPSATRITNIYMEEPPCTNSEIHALPFTEDFENGSTSWPCWTTIDEDGSNNSNMSYWFRSGTRLGNISGNYSARHEFNNSTSQIGWLVTPRLFLQPGQDVAILSFKSSVDGSYTLGVYVTTDETPSASGNWTRVVNQSQSSGTQNITVGLSEFMGHAIYIAFKYTGNISVNWMIDDVSVTESFSPCSSYTAPYSYDFTNGFGSCWTAYDADMTGSTHDWPQSWQPYENWECMCHPYGTPSQTGWLFSPRIQLPSGNYNYTLTYTSKNTMNTGTGETHTVWVASDKTGAYVPADYTQLYSEPDYPTDWTTRTIDLSAYKGHTVSIAFKYTGNNGHTWNIDDFSITQETAQYTITANCNNNAWGSVSGGGTYNAGATCTLVATPASGYQFESWKKNGSVVSTNPTYSFTVTENATYTAYFSEVPIQYYTITTNVTPSGAGTVSGGGTYPEGASVTLTASNNAGYTFDHWQDGNTQNPRTITVTGNATYTATFTQDTYTITTNANPPAGGTVTGGGSNFHYGETCTLTATPASGYEFAGWQDGNTANPRSFTVTGNATYTATFNEVGTTYYTVSANVNPTGAGTVSGTGTYEAGSVIVLTAVANPGYTFDHWQDGSTANPRSVTVNSDLTFTAYFNHNSYTITVNASPAGAGSVSGGGSYYYGDYATLSATAYSGYEFVGWSDGSSENPHQVLVTGNATYTATFSEVGTTYYTVSAYVSPTGAGTVSGTGTFPAGASTTLTATANPGYTFDHWNDGSTTNPRTITVNNNMSFTAYFNTQQYTITTNVTPAGSGTVTGGGTYPYGATATLTATPNSGYEFLQWSDGSLQNPRVITVTGNATYTALFTNGTGDVYTVTVTANFPLLGQVFGGGTYPAGSAVEISAYPNTYARFVKWNDGSTENPRTIIVNSDMEFVAEFVAIQNYTITVESADPERGQAFGGGSYQEGSEIQIAAVAFSGYMFERWQDGNTQNPRTITVNGDATYTAYFVENNVVTYTITLISNTEEGTVSGGGNYIAGTTATIQAFPNPGYVFTKWSDENTDNPRNIVVTNDLTLVAFFATGVGENEQDNIYVYPNPAKESIRIIGIEANTQIEIYNNLGELVKVMSVNADQEIGVRDLASGLYLIRFGNVTMRFVKEQ